MRKKIYCQAILLIIFCLVLNLSGQCQRTYTLTGTLSIVSNGQRIPVNGASLRIKNSNIFTTTRSDGTFSVQINESDLNSEVIVSMIGYGSVTLQIRNTP